MRERFQRTELIYGSEAMDRISKSHVAVFGVGGVGGYVAEALARSGIGRLTLVDSDKVSISNINRQIIATDETVGLYKTEVMKTRIHSINPDAEVTAINMFYLPETASEIDLSQFDFVVDAVDTVTAKLELIVNAQKCGTPIVSSMGAGNKTDASAFRIADIYETSVCPLARVMRAELKKRGIKRLTVVYSTEKPKSPLIAPTEQKGTAGRCAPGSTAFCPSVAGLILAGEVINRIAEI